MLRREKPYVSKPSQSLLSRLEAASSARLFVLQELGPTSFVIKAGESERKHRVSIGSLHTCTCGDREQPCLHTAFVLLRIFRLQPTDHRLWQSSLIDSELEALVDARAHAAALRRKQLREERQVCVPCASDAKSGLVARRPLCGEEGEPCPICYEELSPEEEEAQLLDWCSLGCGKSLHRRCFAMWADHQKSIGKTLTCPFCRTDWMSAPLLPPPPPAPAVGERGSQHRSSQERPILHRNARCRSCRCIPIAGTRYRCLLCSDKLDLCPDCYSSGMHAHHPFAARERPAAEWVICADRPARPSWQAHEAAVGVREGEEGAQTSVGSQLSAADVSRRLAELERREIGPDDYELLLALGEMSVPLLPGREVASARHAQLQMQERLLRRQLSRESEPRKKVELSAEAVEGLVAALNEREALACARSSGTCVGAVDGGRGGEASARRRRSAPFGSTVPRWQRAESAELQAQPMANLSLGGLGLGPSQRSAGGEACFPESIAPLSRPSRSEPANPRRSGAPPASLGLARPGELPSPLNLTGNVGVTAAAGRGAPRQRSGRHSCGGHPKPPDLRLPGRRAEYASGPAIGRPQLIEDSLGGLVGISFGSIRG
ncbi:MAG: hypothetical protein SGPRY_013021 [Prymnesium sp.]